LVFGLQLDADLRLVVDQRRGADLRPGDRSQDEMPVAM